ncbi:hypothetical protein DPB93_25315 [Salmonella enterica subsp. salamae]|nr:hypothetical protein [Salmonella enterica subsp. salamae]ECI4078850.1 hypothetical protein [Salmonella enterica subsp. salamae]EEO2384053.1 hypothetical protein [Salmonella enterica]
MGNFKYLNIRVADRHFFDDLVNVWEDITSKSDNVLPAYVKYEDFIKDVSNEFLTYKGFYTESYVIDGVERGMGIRIVATTTSGQELQAFYELATSARGGAKWINITKVTNGIYAVKHGNLIGNIGENKFFNILNNDRKITLSRPTRGHNVAETVELSLHEDARLIRLEHKGDGNGVDIITKVKIPPPPDNEWAWLAVEIKTGAIHSKDAKEYGTLSRPLSIPQKRGILFVEDHAVQAVERYRKGNPYNLCEEDYKELRELIKDIDKATTKGTHGRNVIGLKVVQALNEEFDYVKNLKYTDAMRIVHSWFGDTNAILK